MSACIPSRNRSALARGAAGLLLAAGIATMTGACGSKGAAPAGNSGGAPTATGGSSSSAKIGVNGSTITIRPAPAKVTMSGDLDASWQGIPAVDINPSDPGVADLGATAQNPAFTDDKVYMQYDSQYLYILESRTQPGPFQANGGDGQYYLGDTFMMFFDTDKDATGTNYIDGDYAFFITPFDQTNTAPRAWDREGHSTGGANEHALTDVKFGYKATKAGYNFAMALPWKEVEVTYNWKVQKGSSVGFALGAASQGADGSWGQLNFNGKGDDQSTWGQLVLG